jgi:hypothetical protein
MKNLIIIGIVAGIVWLMVQFPHTMLSPGELIQGHQYLNNNCVACHTPFGGIANDKCIACHKPSEIGKDTLNPNDTKKDTTTILFHEKLISQSCTECHTDHQGKNDATRLNGFKHDLLPNTITNNCVSCHQKPSDPLHRQLNTNCMGCHNTEGWKNNVTFNHSMLTVADKNDCVSCHTRPPDAWHKTLTAACGQCHSTDKWVPATFDHDAYFVLDRDHNVSCKTCHTNNQYNNYTCYGCHEHTVGNILSEHQEEGIYQINNCVSCHRSAQENDGKNRGNNDGADRNHLKSRENEKDDDD